MTWFFESDENYSRLLNELESWRGTRFLPFTARKGVGADCVQFAEKVFVNLGAIEPVQWPAYVIEGGGEPMLSILLKHVAAVRKLERLWYAPDSGERPSMMRGDLLLVSSGRHLHHFAIFTRYPTVWHCLMTSGVCEGNVDDPLVQKHLMAVYRIRA